MTDPRIAALAEALAAHRHAIGDNWSLTLREAHLAPLLIGEPDSCAAAILAALPPDWGKTTVAFLSSTLEPGPDYTDLLLLIADCLVTLAWKAEPDAGARRSRLDALHAALGSERTGRG